MSVARTETRGRTGTPLGANAAAVGDIREQAFPVGSRTLEVFEGTDRLNRWIYDRFATSLGTRVLEIGAGLGNITQFLVDREQVVATDIEEDYLRRLRDRFVGKEHVTVRKLDLNEPGPEFAQFGVNSVLAVNVLEHIEDDRKALRWIRELVGLGGKACIYVPALPLLYGSLDRALGHHRRYQRSELLRKVEEAGFRVDWCRWMNVTAMPGWFLSGKVLKREIIPAKQVALYDRLVPLLRLEDHLPLPFAMNLTLSATAV